MPDAEDEGLDPKAPTAVVFDTNVWQRGGFDHNKLNFHAGRLAKRGVEVWVPGQVFLEWAAHALADADAFAPVWKRLRAATLVDEPAPVDRDPSSVEVRMRQAIESIPNVQILPMNGGNAVLAIQDQIRGAGAGATKKGVKTGAVDSSLIRDSLSAAGGDPTAVVFVTNNRKDFLGAAGGLGVTLRVCNEQDLYRTEIPHTPVRPVTEEEVDPRPSGDEIAELVRDYMDAERRAVIDADDGHTPSLWSWLAFNGPRLEGVDIDAPYGFELTDVEVRPEPRLVRIFDVDVLDSDVYEDDEGLPTAEYRLSAEVIAEFTGDIIVHGYYIDNDGQVQNDVVDVYDVRIISPYLVDIESGEVVVISPTGEATATERRDEAP